MKDQKNADTVDMFGVKRGRGRPSTGKARSGAERQAAYRGKQQELTVTVTVNREHIDGLTAQLQAIRDGGSAVVLTPEQAGEILAAIRKAERGQLRG